MTKEEMRALIEKTKNEEREKYMNKFKRVYEPARVYEIEDMRIESLPGGIEIGIDRETEDNCIPGEIITAYARLTPKQMLDVISVLSKEVQKNLARG